jgi:outer membrane lipoprotein-sorting protein
MMARFISLCFSCLTLALPIVRADSLEDVLTRMDRSAKDFQSFSANMKRTEYEKVLDDSTDSAGVVRMQRNKDGLTGVIEDGDGKVDYFEGHTAQIYAPKANSVDIIDLGKHANLVQQMILLGFGTRRADLEKNYTIAFGGPDAVAGERTTRIELTPKSKDEKNMVAQIELWIPESQGYPIQEKITLPSKSYKKITYSGMKLPAPPNSSFKLVLPADVHKNYPQK